MFVSAFQTAVSNNLNQILFDLRIYVVRSLTYLVCYFLIVLMLKLRLLATHLTHYRYYKNYQRLIDNSDGLEYSRNHLISEYFLRNFYHDLKQLFLYSNVSLL